MVNDKKSLIIKTSILVVAVLVFLLALFYFDRPCAWTEDKSECLYSVKYAILDPLYYGFKWLTVILLAMAVVPWRIYRYWALTLLPAVLVASYFIISNISVYSSGVLSITRAQMAVNAAVVLAVLSGLFVAGFLLFELYKKRRQELSV